MLDKNLLDEIEKRMKQVRDEGRELTICEKDREYLYINLVEVVTNSILELIPPVPNQAPTVG
jgi:hypothetical protein